MAIAIAVGVTGCRSSKQQVIDRPRPVDAVAALPILPVSYERDRADTPPQGGGHEILPLPDVKDPLLVAPEPLASTPRAVLALDEVVRSVRSNFPLIRQVATNRGIAAGEATSATGAFDHKLEVDSVSQPLDFYENYRSSLTIKRDTMWGGEVFGGYRIGRGFFEPWYLERETNKGGEFKLGFTAPLIRDRQIDANRARLWQAQLEQRRVEPEIYGQVVRYVREGSVAYWNWVAAGADYRVAQGLLDLARERNAGLKAQVEAQEKAAIDLVDNRRIIVSRESKVIDARRKLEQSAIKLSLFYRTAEGDPLLADASLMPGDFNQLVAASADSNEMALRTGDIDLALSQRPELAELQIVRQQLGVALRQAQNETRPDVDGGILVAQDVGEPTSSTRDKSELKLEALLTVSVPIERRTAIGKVRSLRWKLAQVAAKNRFSADKIAAEVRFSSAALDAARERVSWATESYDLALRMQDAERELFDQGQSTLFNLNIREQQTAAAAAGRIEALLEYVVAKADYAAALGFDRPPF